MEKKRCNTCGNEKDVSLFGAQRDNRKGRRVLRSDCKECFYEKKVARYRTKAGRGLRSRYGAKWRESHQDAVVAHRAIRDAVAASEMERPDECSKCGSSGRIEGHHEDYGKPLDVVWVCQPCHIQIHAAERSVRPWSRERDLGD